MAVGLSAIVGPVLILPCAALAKFKIVTWRSVQVTTAIWFAALIMHAGFSHGMSCWGDAASTMGGKNIPYIEAFLTPLMFVVDGFKFRILSKPGAARGSLAAGEACLTLTPKRLLDELEHLLERLVQRLHIIFAFRGPDQGAKVTEGSHLVHTVLRCVCGTIWRQNPASV